MAHYVTCKFCKERFDRDKEPTVKISERRYAHKSCAEKQEALKTQDEKDLEESINNFIKENNIDIIDIKFNSSCSIYGEEQIYCFSALIMYESNNKE